MADLADIMDELARIALQAVFPNGTGQPGVLGSKAIQVGQGWPLARDLDEATRKGRTLVSIFAVPSSTSDAGQPFLCKDEVFKAPVMTLTVSADEAGVTVSGTASEGEYVTVETGRAERFDAKATNGQSAASVASALATALSAKYPGTTASGGRVTVLPTPPRVVARQGAPATMARRTHRQRTQFRISVWAPNPADRAKVAQVIDVAVKSETLIRVQRDGSQALVVHMGTNLDDKFENEGTYRRDLIFNVTYDTVEFYQSFVVTTVGLDTDPVLFR